MKLRNPCCPAASSARGKIPMSTTGTGTCEPNRYTAIMNSVNRILLRRSGTLNALTKALSTGSYPTPSGDDLRPATGLLDLRPRGVREGLCADDERGRDLAAAEDLHGPALADQAVDQEHGGVDLAAGEHLAERLAVADRVLDAG